MARWKWGQEGQLGAVGQLACWSRGSDQNKKDLPHNQGGTPNS